MRTSGPSTIDGRGTGKYEVLLARCKGMAPMPTAIAHPCDDASLGAVVDAAEAGIIAPILVGPAGRIRRVAREAGLDITRHPIDDVPHSHGAAARAVELVRLGRAQILMKGSLHTDELMGEVVKRETGLRTDRRVSHVFMMDVPTYHKPLLITDAAVNIFPTLFLVDPTGTIVNHFVNFQSREALSPAIEAALPKASTQTP